MIELTPGDCIKIKKGYSIESTNNAEDKSYHLTAKFNDGFVLVVKSIEGSSVVCDAIDINFSGRFTAKITVAYDLNNIDPGAIEILRPVEEDSLEESPRVEEPKFHTTPVLTEEDKLNTEYNRFSKALIRVITKRPEVFLYEGALKHLGFYGGNLDCWYGDKCDAATKAAQMEFNLIPIDGVIGKDTATPLIRKAVAAGFEPDLFYRIMSVISFYEGSNDSDIYGNTSIVKSDGAGCNYGFMQCNSLGSVVSLLKKAGRQDLVNSYNSTDKMRVNQDVKDFFGSSAGIDAQHNYFKEKIVVLAMKELHEFGLFDAWEADPSMKMWWERAVLLWCDTIIQNGTMWSPNRKPFWKALESWEKSDPQGYKWPELYYGTWWDEMLGKYITYGVEGMSGLKGMWWEEFAKHGGEGQTISGNKNHDACEAASQSTAKRIILETGMKDDPKAQLVLLGQMRARSSSDVFWFQAVASRRMTDATGSSKNHPEGVVNGSPIDLVADYYL